MSYKSRTRGIDTYVNLECKKKTQGEEISGVIRDVDLHLNAASHLLL
jgi:small nuclear ribonucleoprotein (snRNP)-like protein